ncbi:hypothetical protein [uncultured Campylobacter sp.]|uniref:hypothetical protein n=1 Tax=uncultured Campylobacter sp. TaxID=218934 RepID=UPI002611B7D0|nr:hypothetical protein [uncultured Campylobacter sp.]
MAQLNFDFVPNEKDSKKGNEATPKGSSSKRLIAIFAATIAALLIVLWLFSEDGSAQNSDANLSATAATSDKNLTQENTQALAPPPLSSEVVSMQTVPSVSTDTRDTEVVKKDENLSSLFDDQAIKAAIEKPDISMPEEKEMRVETKASNSAPDEQNPLDLQDQSESKLEKLKNEIRMKKNFFSLNGENFYEGDTILGYKIKEITKENVVLQENDGEIINLNFRSKK